MANETTTQPETVKDTQQDSGAVERLRSRAESGKSSRPAGQSVGPCPMALIRSPQKWYPARHRLIGLVRSAVSSFVLPSAVVRKAQWRE